MVLETQRVRLDRITKDWLNGFAGGSANRALYLLAHGVQNAPERRGRPKKRVLASKEKMAPNIEGSSGVV